MVEWLMVNVGRGVFATSLRADSITLADFWVMGFVGFAIFLILHLQTTAERKL
jgi:hypothetical protein